MRSNLKDKLKRFELFERFGERTFFRTLGEAVSAYLASGPVDWVDWEDRTPYAGRRPIPRTRDSVTACLTHGRAYGIPEGLRQTG